MNAGLLDKRIIIQRASATVDETGQRVETWRQRHTLWARRIESKGKEQVTNDREQSVSDVIFRIRFIDDIFVDYRVKLRDQLFDINDITEVGRRKYLDIHCTRRR